MVVEVEAGGHMSMAVRIAISAQLLVALAKHLLVDELEEEVHGGRLNFLGGKEPPRCGEVVEHDEDGRVLPQGDVYRVGGGML